MRVALVFPKAFKGEAQAMAIFSILERKRARGAGIDDSGENTSKKSEAALDAPLPLLALGALPLLLFT